MESRHRFTAADARSMTFVADNSVALTVTSPPYPMIAMWDEVFSKLSAKTEQALVAGEGTAAFNAMHESLDSVWCELWRVAIPGGIVCINIGDATRRLNDDFRLYSNHSRIISGMEALGFISLPCIHWRKTTNAPTKFMGSGMLPGAAYVTLEHEYILIFRKGPARSYTTAEARTRRESAIFWEERNTWFSDVWELGGSRQDFESVTHRNLGAAASAPTGQGLRGRSAAFPFEIPYRLILMHSIKGDTVLDPFAGTGTTMFAAAACERSSIGVDIEKAVAPVIAGGFAKGTEFWRERAEKRLRDHTAFVAERDNAGKFPAYENPNHAIPVTTGQEKDLRICLPQTAGTGSDGTGLGPSQDALVEFIVDYEPIPVPSVLQRD